MILSLHRKERVSGDRCFRMFYTMHADDFLFLFFFQPFNHAISKIL